MIIARRICTALALSAFSTSAFAGAADLTPPNADIRALEPGVDVTPQQMQAQRPPEAQSGAFGEAAKGAMANERARGEGRSSSKREPTGVPQ